MEDIVAIVSICVVLPALILQAVTRIRTAKYEAQARNGTGEGLRASDLQRLIREAVEDAVEPLHARLDALEASSEPDARLDPAQLADTLGDLHREDAAPAVRRRTRS